MDIDKKIRRVFNYRTHKTIPKLTVHSNKEVMRYKTIIAPYEPTVEKLSKLFKAETEKLILECIPEKRRGGNKLRKSIKGYDHEQQQIGYNQAVHDMKSALTELLK